MKKEFQEQKNRLGVCSSKPYYRYYGDFHLQIFSYFWNHQHSSFYALHSGDSKEYLGMAPQAKESSYHTWQLDCVKPGHYKTTEGARGKEYTLIIYGRRRFNWWTLDLDCIVMMIKILFFLLCSIMVIFVIIYKVERETNF